MKTNITFLFLIFATLFSFAQNSLPNYSTFINKDTIQKNLRFLASDSLQGRNTGEPGQHMAAEYIRESFTRYGLTGLSSDSASQGFYQYIGLQQLSVEDIRIASPLNDITSPKAIFASPGTFRDSANIFFCGNGEKIPEHFPKTTNTLMVICKDVAEMQNQIYDLSAKTGFRNFVVVTPHSSSRNRQFWRDYKILQNYILMHYYPGSIKNETLKTAISIKDTTIHYVAIQSWVLEELTGKSIKKWEKLSRKINKQGYDTYSLEELAAKWFIDGIGKHEMTPIPSQNVAGFLASNNNREECILIGAHYDHLGTKDSLIYNGADDNASGTSAVLELARVFSLAAQQGYRPQKNILFITFTGEEKGLLGSQFYTKYPLIPLSQTACMINMDMIGRQDRKREKRGNGYVYFMHKKDHKKIKATVKKLEKEDRYHLNVDYHRGLAGLLWLIGTDHFWFMRNDVPIGLFYTGKHPDYHKPTDTEEKITYNSLEEIVKLVFDTTVALTEE